MSAILLRDFYHRLAETLEWALVDLNQPRAIESHASRPLAAIRNLLAIQNLLAFQNLLAIQNVLNATAPERRTTA